MLVLSRKAHQSIRLGEDIVITVVGVTGERVRLGIEAPSDVRVLREELQQSAELPQDDEGNLVGACSALVS